MPDLGAHFFPQSPRPSALALEQLPRRGLPRDRAAVHDPEPDLRGRPLRVGAGFVGNRQVVCDDDIPSLPPVEPPQMRPRTALL